MTSLVRRCQLAVVVCFSCSPLMAGEWMTTREGAKLWNPSPQPNETCSWTGATDSAGYATGSGMTVWYERGRITEVSAGSFRTGRPRDGVFYTVRPDGDLSVSFFERGRNVAINRRLEPDEDARPSRDSANANWITSRERAKLWNPNPQPNESCTWTGKRDANGFATGRGMVVWYVGRTIAEVDCHTYIAGRPVGMGAILQPSGRKRVTFTRQGQDVPVVLKIERAAQVARGQSPQSRPQSPGRRSSYRPSSKPDTEAVKRAIAKIVFAGVANAVAKDQAEDEGLLSAIFSVGAKAGRDKLIESALKDVFPDRLESEIRGIRRVASLYLDGRLSLANLGKETAKEEIITALKKENPRLGASAQVVDFLYELHQVSSERKRRN